MCMFAQNLEFIFKKRRAYRRQTKSVLAAIFISPLQRSMWSHSNPRGEHSNQATSSALQGADRFCLQKWRSIPYRKLREPKCGPRIMCPYPSNGCNSCNSTWCIYYKVLALLHHKMGPETLSWCIITRNLFLHPDWRPAFSSTRTRLSHLAGCLHSEKTNTERYDWVRGAM
jgi:hypothetical protein